MLVPPRTRLKLMSAALTQTLSSLRYARYTFEIEATEPLYLPAYKGSTLRGAFGWAFKGATCMTKTFDCPPCLLKTECPYHTLFESEAPPDTAKALRMGRQAPHPFVLEPPETSRLEFAPGERLTYHLVLVGRVIAQLPFFIHAFTRMGTHQGLGRGRGKFKLLAVTDHTGRPIYDPTSGDLDAGYATPVPVAPNLTAPVTTLKLRFITPTRIMTRMNRPKSMLMTPEHNDDFWVLAETLYHRLYNLTQLYCKPTVAPYHTQDIVYHAVPVRLVHANVHWHDWKRYSNRQKRSMKLGGFVGDVQFEGPLTPYAPLFHLGQTLHIGKGTTFGLGRYLLFD